jgi:Tfp pilus assembly protein PilZ
MDERRNEDRIQVCLDAVWDGTGTFMARILDLSEGGCFVDTPGEASIGERLTLKVKLPDGNSLELTGEVAHHMRPVGFGLRFDNLTDQQREQLRSFLDYLRGPHDSVSAVLH